ncbi:MAG: transcription elongation factor Spt5 [Nitrososphaerota archaeon]
MSDAFVQKYFAIKTTVGQERNVARMLENRLYGQYIASGETSDGSQVVGGDIVCAQSFTLGKSLPLKEIGLYLSRDQDMAHRLRVILNRVREDGEEEAVHELSFDPLMMREDGWQTIKTPKGLVLERDKRYSLILSAESPGFRWYYILKGSEPFQGGARVSGDGGRTWTAMDYQFLVRLVSVTDVASILILPSLKGYVFIEAGSKETVAAAIQNIRHIKNRPLITVSLDTISPHLVEKPLIETITPGQMVEIVTGPLRGIVGKVIRVEKPRREVMLELKEAAFQLPISVSIDAVRPLESGAVPETRK